MVLRARSCTQKLYVPKTVNVGDTLHCLISNVLIDIAFLVKFAISSLWKILDEDMLKNYKRHTQPKLILLFNKTFSFTNNYDFE